MRTSALAPAAAARLKVNYSVFPDEGIEIIICSN